MVIHITITNILIGLFSMGALVSFAVWLLKKWIGARIDKSIQHHYDKQLEDYRSSRTRRQKAELIARLFSLWIKYRGREVVLLSKKELIDRYQELNHMSLELSLWIEDEKLLNDVMSRLQNKNEAKSIYELIGEVRKLLLEKEDSFNPLNIVLWPATNEEIDDLFGPSLGK